MTSRRWFAVRRSVPATEQSHRAQCRDLWPSPRPGTVAQRIRSPVGVDPCACRVGRTGHRRSAVRHPLRSPPVPRHKAGRLPSDLGHQMESPTLSSGENNLAFLEASEADDTGTPRWRFALGSPPQHLVASAGRPLRTGSLTERQRHPGPAVARWLRSRASRADRLEASRQQANQGWHLRAARSHSQAPHIRGTAGRTFSKACGHSDPRSHRPGRRACPHTADATGPRTERQCPATK